MLRNLHGKKQTSIIAASQTGPVFLEIVMSTYIYIYINKMHNFLERNSASRIKLKAITKKNFFLRYSLPRSLLQSMTKTTSSVNLCDSMMDTLQGAVGSLFLYIWTN